MLRKEEKLNVTRPFQGTITPKWPACYAKHNNNDDDDDANQQNNNKPKLVKINIYIEFEWILFVWSPVLYGADLLLLLILAPISTSCSKKTSCDVYRLRNSVLCFVPVVAVTQRLLIYHRIEKSSFIQSDAVATDDQNILVLSDWAAVVRS